MFGSTFGKVAEWSNAPDSKSGIPFYGIEGSNPSLSARYGLRTFANIPQTLSSRGFLHFQKGAYIAVRP
jgi:hypothetical protein